MNFHSINIFSKLFSHCRRNSIVHHILIFTCYILLLMYTMLFVACSQNELQNTSQKSESQNDSDEFILCPPDLDSTSFAGDKFETITIGFSKILEGIFPADGYTLEEPMYISLNIPSTMTKSDEYYGTTEFQKHTFSINEVNNPSSIVVNGIYDISNIADFNIKVNNVFEVWEAYPELTEKEKTDILSKSTNGISFKTINGYNGVLNISGLSEGSVLCEATIELKENLIVCIRLSLPVKDVGVITYILQSIFVK